MFPLYSLLLRFCVRVSSSELEPEPMEELSWLSGGQVRKPSPDSDREGVRVRERILSRLFGLISFLIFKVIQLPRLPRTERARSETQGQQQQKESIRQFCVYFKGLFHTLNSCCNQLFNSLQTINIS